MNTTEEITALWFLELIIVVCFYPKGGNVVFFTSILQIDKRSEGLSDLLEVSQLVNGRAGIRNHCCRRIAKVVFLPLLGLVPDLKIRFEI